MDEDDGQQQDDVRFVQHKLNEQCPFVRPIIASAVNFSLFSCGFLKV